jgi:capsular exopolysaccharide synthesis family protein
MKLQKNQSQINIKKELLKYLSFWKLFVISIILCFSATYFYVKYKSPVYYSQSKIKLLSDGNNINLPPDFNSIFNNTSYIKLVNEMATLKSKRIIDLVVKDLNLTTKYYTKGKIRNIELWNVPVKITSIEKEDTIFPTLNFNIKLLNDGYKISNDTLSFVVKGQSVKTKIGNQEFLIEPNPNFSLKNNKKDFYVEVYNSTYITENLLKNLIIEPYDKQSDILCISLQDVNIEKTNAIVNKIVEKLDEDGIKDRQIVSKRTIEFIDDRFNYLIDELNTIENKKKDYKRSNNLSFIEQDAVIDVQKKFETKDQVLSVETQIELSNLLREALFNNEKFGLLPSNIGIENSSLNELVNQYNNLIIQRESLLKTGGKQNPAIINLESQILISKNNINQSINTYLKQLKLNLAIQKVNYKKTSDLVYKLPTNEKVLRGIERQQQVKENLYLLLLQKREESAIAYAITTPSIKVLDYANASIIPVEPKKDLLYLSALLIGVFIPYVLISLYFFLNTKIKSINEQEFINSEIPIIGEIPFFEENKIFIDKNDRSVHSEIFRILTSNCKFLLPLKESNQGQVIMVTSSIMGEGKTFITSNLALAFASYDSKILLIGADMRKPKLKETLNMDHNGFGLSSYLSDNTINWKDLLVINNEYNSDLSILFGGIIPPNPSNLFSNLRFEKLIEEAKKEFDYIIIDCPPTIYVNDTFLISKHADLTVYITRFNVTDKELINYSKNLQVDNKLKNMAYVLNGIKSSSSFNYNYNYKYNYGYGYGYGNEDKNKSKSTSLFKRLKKINKYFKN